MKPNTADSNRDQEIVLIHVGKRELKLDEDTYRAMLFQIGGDKSAKNLSAAGRKKVLDHMKARGFKVKQKAVNKNAQDARYRKIRALWKDLKARGMVKQDTDSAVRAYIKRTAHVDDFQFMNDHQINTVIESLKKWIARADENNDPALTQSKETENV